MHILMTQAGRASRAQHGVDHTTKPLVRDLPLRRPDVLQQFAVVARKISPRRAHDALGERRPTDIGALVRHRHETYLRPALKQLEAHSQLDAPPVAGGSAG